MNEDRKEKAIHALLSQPTIKKAAEVSGIGERTLHTYLDDPEFKREYQERRRNMMESACGVLTSHVGYAIAALLEITTDKRAGKIARVNAARTILEYALKTFEEMDLQARIETLESALNGSKQQIETDFLDGL